MTQLVLTLLFVAIPYALLFGPAVYAWNKHNRASAVGYTALVVVAVLVWQNAWTGAA
jgi:hypothetical protein